MPELPEVETIKRDLEKKIIGRTIVSVESDWLKTIKEPEYGLFSNLIPGKKIKDVSRRAKNLIIELTHTPYSKRSAESLRKFLLIHFKMTGHLIIADSKYLNNDHWEAKDSAQLTDRVNQFIHLAFYLDNGQVMALSDLRKFARVSLVSKERLDELLAGLGPEPLAKNFTYEVFLSRIEGKKGQIKKILLEQNIIAGIGNIYADEILFESGVVPWRLVFDLNSAELKRIYGNIINVLTKAVKLRGTSTSDYRDTSGKKGGFADVSKVYRKTGELCPNNCGGLVRRTKIGGRSSHYCEICQK